MYTVTYQYSFLLVREYNGGISHDINFPDSFWQSYAHRFSCIPGEALQVFRNNPSLYEEDDISQEDSNF